MAFTTADGRAWEAGQRVRFLNQFGQWDEGVIDDDSGGLFIIPVRQGDRGGPFWSRHMVRQENVLSEAEYDDSIRERDAAQPITVRQPATQTLTLACLYDEDGNPTSEDGGSRTPPRLPANHPFAGLARSLSPEVVALLNAIVKPQTALQRLAVAVLMGDESAGRPLIDEAHAQVAPETADVFARLEAWYDVDDNRSFAISGWGVHIRDRARAVLSSPTTSLLRDFAQATKEEWPLVKKLDIAPVGTDEQPATLAECVAAALARWEELHGGEEVSA